ncbi:MAG: hypothetical protein AB8B50_08130 [Pirellulaceae bacterium]
MEKEINVLAMMKGEERYVFLFDDKNRVETLRTLGRYAADPSLSFTWYDAAVMSKKIRELSAELEEAEQSLDASSYVSPMAAKQAPRFSFSPEEDII